MKFKLTPVDEKPEEKKMDFELIPVDRTQFEEDIYRARRYTRKKEIKIDPLEKAWVERNLKREYTIKIK